MSKAKVLTIAPHNITPAEAERVRHTELVGGYKCLELADEVYEAIEVSLYKTRGSKGPARSCGVWIDGKTPCSGIAKAAPCGDLAVLSAFTKAGVILSDCGASSPEEIILAVAEYTGVKAPYVVKFFA